MHICISGNHALFRTPFSKTHDLIQLFRGIEPSPVSVNGPVDFMSAGLTQIGKPDAWHHDIPLTISTDEATPCMINGAWIGAGHGQPCVVEMYAPCHDKTYQDIGSLWQDASGMKWTLVRIINADWLGFVSENIGESDARYAFVKKIESALTYISDGVHPREIMHSENQAVSYLNRCLRFIKKEIIGYKNGEARRVTHVMNCDYAEINEEYEIMNPALVADALRQNRPKDGYTTPQPFDIGKPILRHRMTYRIMPDGTILCIFDLEKCMDIDFQFCMCAMYQEKLDVFGGGIHRAIPGVLPFETEEGAFDFSMPVRLFPGPFPKNHYLTPKDWANPDWAPDRFVDVFRDNAGQDRMGFAAGYLPILDGQPQYRKQHLPHAALLYHSRKAYPTFIGGVERARGVAYKKYFKSPVDKTSVYTVPYEGKTYIYVDCFGGDTAFVPVSGTARPLDVTEGVTFALGDGVLSVSGEKGHAVFIAE